MNYVNEQLAKVQKDMEALQAQRAAAGLPPLPGLSSLPVAPAPAPPPPAPAQGIDPAVAMRMIIEGGLPVWMRVLSGLGEKSLKPEDMAWLRARVGKLSLVDLQFVDSQEMVEVTQLLFDAYRSYVEPK